MVIGVEVEGCVIGNELGKVAGCLPGAAIGCLQGAVVVFVTGELSIC